MSIMLVIIIVFSRIMVVVCTVLIDSTSGYRVNGMNGGLMVIMLNVVIDDTSAVLNGAEWKLSSGILSLVVSSDYARSVGWLIVIG